MRRTGSPFAVGGGSTALEGSAVTGGLSIVDVFGEDSFSLAVYFVFPVTAVSVWLADLF